MRLRPAHCLAVALTLFATNSCSSSKELRSTESQRIVDRFNSEAPKGWTEYQERMVGCTVTGIFNHLPFSVIHTDKILYSKNSFAHPDFAQLLAKNGEVFVESNRPTNEANTVVGTRKVKIPTELTRNEQEKIEWLERSVSQVVHAILCVEGRMLDELYGSEILKAKSAKQVRKGNRDLIEVKFTDERRSQQEVVQELTVVFDPAECWTVVSYEMVKGVGGDTETITVKHNLENYMSVVVSRETTRFSRFQNTGATLISVWKRNYSEIGETEASARFEAEFTRR